jgi:signal recognition particle receptor subunit beta
MLLHLNLSSNLMKFTGAQIREQGQSFALVLITSHAASTQHTRQEAMQTFSRYFPGIPLVLACQGSGGLFTYYGRQDIANFLANLDPRRIPWKEYTVS